MRTGTCSPHTQAYAALRHIISLVCKLMHPLRVLIFKNRSRKDRELQTCMWFRKDRELQTRMWFRKDRESPDLHVVPQGPRVSRLAWSQGITRTR
jgi:hypothetical protein